MMHFITSLKVSETKELLKLRTFVILVFQTIRSLSQTEMIAMRRTPKRGSLTSQTTLQRLPQSLMVSCQYLFNSNLFAYVMFFNFPSVLFFFIPDQVQPRVFNEQFAPSLKAGSTIVVASGYNVFYKFLSIPASSNVVMVAPR